MSFDNNNDNLVKIAALLIHAAKIDQNYSTQEGKLRTRCKLDDDYLL